MPRVLIERACNRRSGASPRSISGSSASGGASMPSPTAAPIRATSLPDRRTHGGRLERAADHDRARAARGCSAVFESAFSCRSYFSLRKSMLPCAVDQLRRRVDDQQVGHQHAVASRAAPRPRSGSRAVSSPPHQQRRGAREIEVRQHEPQRARFAAAHRDGSLAVGRARTCSATLLPVVAESRAPAERGRPIRSARRAAERCASARRCALRSSPAQRVGAC